MIHTIVPIFIYIASIMIGVLLYAAAFKARIEVSDLQILYIPTFILAAVCIAANVLQFRTIAPRIKYASVFLLLLGAASYSYGYGNFGNTEILERIALNCGLGMLVALIPWTKKSLSFLYLVLAAMGVVLALSTFSVYETVGNLSGYDEELREGYLSVTFAAGIGCIASLHKILERNNPIYIVMFIVCWAGIALSLGRGSLLFCAIISLVYVLVALFRSVSPVSKRKKIFLVLIIAAVIPFVFYQAMSIERTANRMLVLFTDTEAGSGIAGRLNEYSWAIKSISRSPVFGNGLGAYIGDPDVVLKGAHPHNILLQYTIDGGFIALLMLLIFIFIIVMNMRWAMRKSSKNDVIYAMTSAALFIFMFLSYLKSHDAYRGREMFVLSAIPLVTHLAMKSRVRLSGRRGKRVRSRKRSRSSRV